MKNFVYLFAAGLMTLSACNNGPSYQILGTAEGMADSTVVYLQKAQGRNLVYLDSTMVSNGKFHFSGRQDTAIHRYVSTLSEGIRYRVDFFLENGNIHLTLGNENNATGTPCNDAYVAFKKEYNSVKMELNDLRKKMMTDATLTQEQRTEMSKKFGELDAKAVEIVNRHLKLNASNKVGEHLFPSYTAYMNHEQQKAVLAKMPAEVLTNNRQIARIAKHVEILDKTAVGQQFTDFEMPTADGKNLKLSDIVSRNKYTLVDFWASWCAPCRAEMPNVIAAYNEFHPKGFDVVGVSLDNDEAAWKASIKSWKMPWTHVSDLKSTDNAAALLYGIQSIPSTVLIAQDGTIVARNLRAEALKEKLAELLK